MKQESRWTRATRALGRTLGQAWQATICALANLRRRLLHSRLPDYVIIPLDHELSELTPDVPWWTAYIPALKLPLSLGYLSRALRRIAAEPDVQGVVFLMKGPSLSLAQAQSLAQIFDRFRRWDSECRAPGRAAKRIIVHLETVSTPIYTVACAADVISLAPLASWNILGLRAAPIYLKDTLARFGVEVDVVKIAPWKTAADRFIRTGMSEAERAQYNWLLDSLAEDIVGAIAAGRGLSPEVVQGLIDRAPLTAEEACAAGLVDMTGYEDQLAVYLGEGNKPARLRPYAAVRGLLLRRTRAHPVQEVGILSLMGAITLGESRNSPIPLPILGGRILGSAGAEQQIRKARRDDSLAAVVLHVDSNGGSALASDLIWREVELLNQEKPVVVYMGDVAASGGYYIAAPARKIVAQSATLTGSIGVIIAKPVTAGALDKAHAHREIVQRGENAGLYAEDSAWDERQRAQIEAQIQYAYQEFKRRVADGRKLDYAALDAICNGRVWTGKQARAHGLVDELGDFQTALELACAEANLPVDGSVRTRIISAPRSRLPAAPVDAAKALLGLDATGPLHAAAAALLQGDWQRIFGPDHVWLIADGLPKLD